MFTKKHSFSFKNSDGNLCSLTDKQYCFMNSCIKYKLHLISVNKSLPTDTSLLQQTQTLMLCFISYFVE